MLRYIYLGALAAKAPFFVVFFKWYGQVDETTQITLLISAGFKFLFPLIPTFAYWIVIKTQGDAPATKWNRFFLGMVCMIQWRTAESMFDAKGEILIPAAAVFVVSMILMYLNVTREQRVEAQKNSESEEKSSEQST